VNNGENTSMKYVNSSTPCR